MRALVVAAGCWLLGCGPGEDCEGEACGRANVECRSNDDCDDQLACTGEETCEESRCVAGAPVECEESLSCAEREDGTACEFDDPSPWYVYVGNDLGAEPLRLFGVRQADMGRLAPLDLTAAVATSEYAGPTFRDFSPDGRFLVFDLANVNFESRLFFVEFGAGLPSAAEPVPNLPVSDAWDPWIDWSESSKSAVMRESTGVYWLDFHGDEPTTSLLARDDATVTFAQPCADGLSVVYDTEESDQSFVATAPSLADAEPLGGHAFVAPGGTHVAVFVGDGVWTAECGVGKAWRFHETGPLESDGAGWSPDARFLQFPVLGQDEQSTDLVVVDAGGDDPPWRAGGSALSAEWAEGAGARLVFEADPDLLFSVATFPGGEVRNLGLPTDTLSATLHDSGMSYRLSDEATETTTEWLLLDGWSEAARLDDCDDPSTRYDAAPRSAACTQETLVGWNLFAFSVDSGSLTRVQPGATVTEELSIEGFSPDGRGFVALRSSSAPEEALQKIVWVEAPFEDGMPLPEVNRGTLGYDPSWQPVARTTARRR